MRSKQIPRPPDCLIPLSVWDEEEFTYITLGLSETENKLMALQLPELENYLKEISSDYGIRYNSSKKKQYWLCIAFSHPDMSSENLLSLAKDVLDLGSYDVVDAAALFGNVNFFKYLQENNILNISFLGNVICRTVQCGYHGIIEIMISIITNQNDETIAQKVNAIISVFKQPVTNNHGELVAPLLLFTQQHENIKDNSQFIAAVHCCLMSAAENNNVEIYEILKKYIHENNLALKEEVPDYILVERSLQKLIGTRGA